MVQSLSKLQRVHQGLAASVFPVKPDQAFTPDQESGDFVAIDLDPGQIPAIAQEKRPSEDIRDLKDMLVHSFTSFLPLKAGLIFSGRYDRKRKANPEG
jgi:hypothetical protein